MKFDFMILYAACLAPAQLHLNASMHSSRLSVSSCAAFPWLFFFSFVLFAACRSRRSPSQASRPA